MTRDIIRRNDSLDAFTTFDRLFKSFFDGFEEIAPSKYPPVNVSYFYPNKEEFEKTDESTRLSNFEDLEPYFIIEVALAGFEKKDLQVQCDDTVLRISGSTKERDFNNNLSRPAYYSEKKLLSNLAFRDFDRVFTFKVPVEVKSASFTNGILSVHVYPKKPKAGQIVPIS
jgi:HSP20 family molecular chaperone IbpA